MRPLPAAERISPEKLLAGTLDTGSFRSWDAPLPRLAIEDSYAEDLAAARAKSGRDESILTGEGMVGGRKVAVVLSDFAFLGGSIGINAATRITSAIGRATRQGLPLLVSPASGGTRMQEGTAAFLQMVRITAAVNAHKKAGLPYLVYLRHPTTGGVFASWGSLGHLTAAQPRAMIGFLGPKVYRALSGQDFPAGVQQAENLYRHGNIDAVIDPVHLRRFLLRILNVLDARPSAIPSVVPTHSGPSAGPSAMPSAVPVSLRHKEQLPTSPAALGEETDSWASVVGSRQAQRPGLRSFLSLAATNVVPLGQSAGETRKTMTVVLATIGGVGAVVVGLDRKGADDGTPLGPAALREARRGMSLAEDLGLPLLTVIDTPGAELSRAAEEGALGREIAFTLARMLDLRTPTVTLLLGQGSGGGALALFPADRIIALTNSWLAPLLPEGASAIVHGNTRHAMDLAQNQRIGARAMLEDELVDEVVDEPAPSAGLSNGAFFLNAAAAVGRHLRSIGTTNPDILIQERCRRYAATPVPALDTPVLLG